MKENLLISTCLLGNNTKYNGKNNLNQKALELEKYFNLIKICPEMDGGLPCPRDPSEILGDKVISSNNKDVTLEYTKGALNALELAKKYNVRYAVLKEKSPSCGVHLIYDGTFNGVKIQGLGITTRLLVENGITVFNEDEIDSLLELVK